MTNISKPIPLILIFGAAIAFQPIAQAGWWDRAKSLLKSDEAGQVASELSTGEIGDAFKQALKMGAQRVVTRLGEAEGFNADPEIHIPLPESLQKVKSVLVKAGLSGMVDDLELKLNRAAEAATPKARALFVEAINEMTFDDVMRIYKGSKDSATQYFREKMSPALKEEMQPIIDNSLSQVGAIQTFDKVMGKYESLPFVPDIKADLSGHVVQKAMDGIFFYLAREEAEIRENPAKQTTELLKKVFGAK